MRRGSKLFRRTITLALTPSRQFPTLQFKICPPLSEFTTSQCDIAATKAVGDALKSLNIKLLDHIIVTDTGYLSFAEQGLL